MAQATVDGRVAAARIFENHLADCYTVAVRMLGERQPAEDAVIAAVRFAGHDLERNGPPPAPRKWAVLHVVNACLLAARRPRSRTAEDPTLSLADRPGTELRDMRPLFNAGLSFLSPDVRATIVLHDFAGLFVSDISELLGLEETHLRTMLHGGRLFLRDYVAMSFGMNAYAGLD